MRDTPERTLRLADDLTVLVRGWLHGNSVLIAGPAPVLIDTGYHLGVDALRAWIGDQLGGACPALRVLLTHAHSDHAGGVAALAPASVAASAATAALAEAWDERGLWIGSSGQQMPRFQVDQAFVHGDVVDAGRAWQVIGTPGHMRSAVAFFSADDGLLVTGDALWEDGFGMLDPWVEGPGCFDDAALALARLRALSGVRCVIPGHGLPFADLGAALDRADRRLAALARDPDAIRRMVALGGFAFLAMARPDLSRAQVTEVVRAVVADHAPRGPGQPDADAVVASALAELSARRRA